MMSGKSSAGAQSIATLRNSLEVVLRVILSAGRGSARLSCIGRTTHENYSGTDFSL
jgi:hypothetical protein